jgi:hypothetical protein
LAEAVTAAAPQAVLCPKVVENAIEAGIKDVKEISPPATTSSGADAADGDLSRSAVDSIVEVGLVQIALAGSGGSDPQLTLRVRAAARLFDAATEYEIWRDDAIDYSSPPRLFSEWSADGA